MLLKPIWLLDFDGVVNALSKRGARTHWPDWRSAGLDHPHGELSRTGKPIRLQLLWSKTVVGAISDAAAGGVNVQWLSTWREHTALLPDLIPGLPELGFLDERILDTTVAQELEPQRRMESGPWKIEVAKAFVPEGAPLLWTDDALSIELLSETWRRSRSGPTEFLRPRPHSGLIGRDVRTINEWVQRHTGQPGGT